MTVKELIGKLQEMPQDQDIYVQDASGWGHATDVYESSFIDSERVVVIT